MLEYKSLHDIFQNKNVIMFLASMAFMCGIMSCFYNIAEVLSIFCTIILLILLYMNLINIRKIIFFCLIFYAGFFLTFCKIKSYDDLSYIAPANVELIGRISTIPITTDHNKTKFFIKVSSNNGKEIRANTFVTLSGDNNLALKLNIGDEIQIKGKLNKPFTSTNPAQFDYGEYLKNFNTFTTLYSQYSDIKTLDTPMSFKWKFLQKLNNTRNDILAVHAKYLKSPNLEILGGIVFGDDAVATPEKTKKSFRNSGLLHILAASGMNVGFIFTFWFFLTKLARIPYQIRIISGMGLVILYTFMTGLGASVIRAALMLLFVLAGKLIDRDAHSVSLLSLVAVLMLIYNPAYINNVSFQFSFLVTLGLLTTANVLSAKLTKIPNWIKIPIIIPLIAQIWVAPVQMFYFNTFNLYSILANISTVSILSIISFMGFISSVLAIFPKIFGIICSYMDLILNWLLNILVYISNFFSELKYSTLQTTHPDICQIFLYYIMLIVITYLIKYDKFKYAVYTLISISVILILGTIKPISNDLEIITFDVQNADSFLIKTPMNKYFMIDTGKAPYDSGNSQANIIILKYLKDRGLKNIEGIIVTHFDNDHSGGTADIISNTKTAKLYLNSNSKKTLTAKNIFETAAETKTPYEIASNNKVIYQEPNFEIKTFKANMSGKDESNDNSIITLITYKDFNMLFMGDAGINPFNKVKQNIPHNIEVLKVGHHGGAKTVNEEMLLHLNNQVSIISTGINYYGHPNKGTLDTLRKTTILRTDLLNSIKLTTDGNEYKIFTYDTHAKNYELKEKFFSK